MDILDGKLPPKPCEISGVEVIARKLSVNPGGILGVDVLDGTILFKPGFILDWCFLVGSHSDVSYTTAAEWFGVVLPPHEHLGWFQIQLKPLV